MSTSLPVLVVQKNDRVDGESDTITNEDLRLNTDYDDEDRSVVSFGTGASPTASSTPGGPHGFPDKDESSYGQGTHIAYRENQLVMIWRGMVILGMLLITVAVASAANIYVASKEQESFETSFYYDSFTIMAAFRVGILQRFLDLDSIAMAMVSYANTTGKEWPLVTMPNYAIRSAKRHGISGAVAIETFHLVNDSSNGRNEWEEYSRENSAMWVEQTLEVQDIDEAYEGVRLAEDGYKLKHQGIWYGEEVVPTNSGP